MNTRTAMTPADAAAAVPRRASLRSYAGSPAIVAAGTLVVLLAVSALLRTGSISGPFWIDEGLSVGIASHSLTDIPGLLRQDGSPPLYYLLLHGWMDVFGSDEAATHALSLLFALLAIPVALWAGWSLFGRRAGLVAATLAAVNPLMSAYAQETRMYTLLLLLGLLASAAFLHVFAYRRRAYLALLVPAMTAMLYTHNWAGFFCVGAVAALFPVFRTSPDRRAVAIDAAIAFGLAGLLYLPWLPTLVSQAAHTGAPWASHPPVKDLTHASYVILGNAQIATALALAGGAGIAAVIRRRIDSAEAVSAMALLILTTVALVVAWVYSQTTLAWAPRYLIVLTGPLLLAAALGVARAGVLGLAGLAIAVYASVMLTGSYIPENKSNVERLADRLGSRVRAGDLVVSTQPEQVPNLKYYLPQGLRYATPMGPVKDPGVMDWRDAVDRLRAARPSSDLLPLVRDLPPGTQVLLVSPVTRRSGWRSTWTSLVKRRSRQWEHALAADPRVAELKRLKRPRSRSRLSTVKAVLYVRRH
jgi:mannosyltransferase